MDGLVECGGVGEGLMGEAMGFEVTPDRPDIVEFGRVFRQRQPWKARIGRGATATTSPSSQSLQRPIPSASMNGSIPTTACRAEIWPLMTQ